MLPSTNKLHRGAYICGLYVDFPLECPVFQFQFWTVANSALHFHISRSFSYAPKKILCFIRKYSFWDTLHVSPCLFYSSQKGMLSSSVISFPPSLSLCQHSFKCPGMFSDSGAAAIIGIHMETLCLGLRESGVGAKGPRAPKQTALVVR